MDSPFGHHNKHHHTSGRDEEVEDRREHHYQQPPPPGDFRHEPPPPYSGGGVSYGYEPPPPPPFSSVTHQHQHQHHPHEPAPPQFNTNYGGGEFGYGHNPPPPQPNRYDNHPAPTSHVQHVSHETSHPTPAYGRHENALPNVQHVSHETSHPTPAYGRHENALPNVQHVSHEVNHPTPGGSGFASSRPTVRIFTKAETNFSLTIRHGQVVLAPADPRDDYQHWIKDEKWSTKVKDAEGHPSFSLVNKATGQAIKHSIAGTQPVQLVPYNQNAFDESVLWAESKDLGDTYKCIRMVNNIKLNLDAFNGDKEHGGVHDGTVAVLWEWAKGDNQRWKIAPYCKFHHQKLKTG